RLYASKKDEDDSADSQLANDNEILKAMMADYTRQQRKPVSSSNRFREQSTSMRTPNSPTTYAAKRNNVAAASNENSLANNTMSTRNSNYAAQRNNVAAASNEKELASIPDSVSIQILSNGTTHMAPCIAIRTPRQTYLFNAPEGT
ncbi:hypothetical protein PMAYCL1PPCAC_26128, partial [Pristionchus mayeri]